MLLFEQKKHGINFITVWYASDKLKKKGIISYREAIFLPKERCSEFDTLLTDLTPTQEQILAGFTSGCRNLVKRGSREDITTSIQCNDGITDEDIDAFIHFFIEFWKSKGVEYKEKEKLKEMMTYYRNSNAIAIGKANLDGEVAVYHTYIIGGGFVRLLHSASLYRMLEGQDNDNRKLVGIANRYLHFEEMKYFKENGFATYDWGGAGKQDEVKNITEFKSSFGGNPITYYDFEDVVGLKAHLFKLLIKILRK